MVTSATGKGVPVLDFLALSQSKDMMKTVLQHFVDTNEGALDKVKSIVIDKDYKEWEVLEEVFTRSTVVLCQFHVLKYFKQVVQNPKYKIPSDTRDEALGILTGMVYASTVADLEAYKDSFATLFRAKKYVSLLEYMESWWYNCTEMWSNSGRGNIFTATNTTSNRLESNWFQLKVLVAKKKRIDHCLESIFTHMTTVIRREKREFAAFLTSTSLHIGAHEFIAPVYRELSDYASGLVREQWVLYTADRASYSSTTPVTRRNLYVVRVDTDVRPLHFSVDVRMWSCTCHTYRGSELPCRHMLFVARDHLKMDVFPTKAIPVRWRMDQAPTLVPKFSAAINELETLRLESHHLGSRSKSTTASTTATVAHVRLRRREVHNTVVLEAMEKRKVVLGLFEAITEYMMAQGTVRFRDLAVDLAEKLAVLEGQWKNEQQVRLPATAADESYPSPVTDGEDRSDDDGVLSESDHFDFSYEPDPEVHNEERTGVAASAPATTNRSNLDVLDMRPLFDSQVSSLDLGSQVSSQGLVSGSSLADGVVSAILQDTIWGASTNPTSFNSPPRAIRTATRLSAVSLQAMLPVDDEVPSTIEVPGDEDPAETLTVPHVATCDVPPLSVGENQPSRMPDVLDTPSRNTRGAAKRTASAAVLADRGTRLPELGGTVSSVVLANAGRRGNPKKAKQQATSATGRVAPLNQSTNCPVQLRPFVQALQHGTALQDSVRLAAQYPVLMNAEFLKNRGAKVTKHKVLRGLFDFNFVVPKFLVKIVQGAVDMAREVDEEEISSCTPHDLTSPVRPSSARPIYVARMTDIRPFSEDTIRDLVAFYDVKKLLKHYVKNMSWLAASSAWAVRDDERPVPFLQNNASDWECCFDSLRTVNTRAKAITALESSSLKTILTVQKEVDLTQQTATQVEKPAQLCVANLIGGLARDAQLNDAVIRFALYAVSAGFDDVVIIESLEKSPTPPSTDLKNTRLVVFPINIFNMHWALACVRFTWSTDVKPVAFLYDPLAAPNQQRRLQETWEKRCVKFLHEWFQRDVGRPLDDMDTQLISKPVQSDGNSCGLMCIVQAFCYITDDFECQQTEMFSPYAVKLMRLRLLLLILEQSRRDQDEGAVAQAKADVGTFGAYYRALTDSHGNSKRRNIAIAAGTGETDYADSVKGAKAKKSTVAKRPKGKKSKTTRT